MQASTFLLPASRPSVHADRMKFSHALLLSCLTCAIPALAMETPPLSSQVLSNRAPLAPKPYLELPLGQVQPRGWLRLQLERMRDGLTGNLDERYPSVVGSRNGWLGGDGDGWERGPYWLDGLVPLAYILQDEKLIQKARPWIEWKP